MSNGARQATGGATYRMLRELGSRAQHSFAAIREPHELLVAQRFVRVRTAAHVAHAQADGATPADGETMALLLRDARCLAKNWHPNIARVRHVDLAQMEDGLRTELTIASELLEGATLEELAEAEPRMPPPVLVRILLDVLAGLAALFALRDAMGAPLGAIHGELCPANVVVGKDGVARIVNVLRKRPVQLELGSEGVSYAAPEALDTGGTEDPRSDVYAVGVMLWEGLAGHRLSIETDPARMLSRQREGELVAPPIDPSAPFARLAGVAMRAMSFDPSLRFRGPAEMATELREIAGKDLALGGAVAATVMALAGDRIRMRKALLDPGTSGMQLRALPTLQAEISMDLIAASRPTSPDPLAPGAPTVTLTTEEIIAQALASATEQMRAGAMERPAIEPPVMPQTSTPGDFVIPIDVTATLHEGAPRRRRRFAAIVAAGAVMLAAMGVFVGVRGNAGKHRERAAGT
ncbi:MAG: hypothetical protein JWP87_5855, partial [Labilithrix sp.]|nr:hypothetical protein [Labilithrix sp.]